MRTIRPINVRNIFHSMTKEVSIYSHPSFVCVNNMWKKTEKKKRGIPEAWTWGVGSLTSRPSHQILTVCKNRGGRSGPFYNVIDISVYLEGGSVPDCKTKLEDFFGCFCSNAGVSNVHEANNIPFLVQDEKRMHEMHVALSLPHSLPPSLSPSVYLSRYWHEFVFLVIKI